MLARTKRVLGFLRSISFETMLDTAIAKLVQVSYDANYGLALSSGIHITQNTYPELYEILVECADALNIPVPYGQI